MRSYRVEGESDKYESVSIVAVPPRRRDVWRILRGTYVPEVRVKRTLTTAGVARTIKEVWTGPAVREAMHQRNPLLERLLD